MIENFIIMFGWEGLDYMVVIFFYCLDVKSMIIWKDVFGVFMGDLRFFENVSKLDLMFCKEVIEMIYYGVKVIYLKIIKFL